MGKIKQTVKTILILGEKKSPLHKLTEQQVKEIYLSNFGYRKLSKIYNVSSTNIRNIKKKLQWKWLTDTLD